MKRDTAGSPGTPIEDPSGSSEWSANFLKEFLIHELRRNKRTWAVLGVFLAIIYAVNLRRIDTTIPFLDLTFVTFIFPLIAFSLALFPMTRQSTEGSAHLTLSIPAPGRAFLGARLLATAIPLSLLALPSWSIEAIRLGTRVGTDLMGPTRMLIYQSGFLPIHMRTGFYGELYLVGGPITVEGHLVVLGAITFSIIVSSVFGVLTSVLVPHAGSQRSGARGASNWAIPALMVLFVFLILPLIIQGDVAKMLPWPPPVSCSGWFFGIQECTVTTATIVLLFAVAGAAFWLSVWLWDWRLEVQ